MGSRNVMDDDFVAILQEVFSDLRQAYGERAHLYRVDVGTFVEVAETQDTVFLTGEFVDLEDGAIYRFTMDGVQQRMRYESTGRYHSSVQTSSSVETASSAKAASARQDASPFTQPPRADSRWQKSGISAISKTGRLNRSTATSAGGSERSSRA